MGTYAHEPKLALLSAKDLAERWGFNVSTIHKMKRRGELPPRIEISGRRVWRLVDIEHFEKVAPRERTL